MHDDVTSDEFAPKPQGRHAPSHASPLPAQIAGYRIVRRLDSGGQAVVYEAQQDNPPQTVAIKVLRGDRASNFAQDRFWYEAELLARVNHPAVVKVFATGTWDPGTGEVPYIVMEYVPGAWMLTEYADNSKLDLRERLALIVEVCDAVHHAHVRGIIHRDIKPGNVLVDAQRRPRLIDFGVARGPKEDFENRTRTMPGQIVGTMLYLAPEQTLGDQALVDVRSDVYALGLLLYRLVCDRLPYEVDDADDTTARKIIRERPPIRPSTLRDDIGEDLEAVMLKALAKDPDDRYQTAREFAQDISALLDGRPIRARLPGRWGHVRAAARRVVARYRKSCMTAAAALGAAIAVLAGPYVVDALFLENAYQASLVRVTHPPRPADMLDRVRVIGITDDTSAESLKVGGGLDHVDLAELSSLRAVHGRLLDRLARAGVRCVVFDMTFRGTTPHDDAFSAGLDALHAVGVEVVAARTTWDLQSASDAEQMAEFVPRMLRGSVLSGLSTTSMWRVELALLRRPTDVLPSLALIAAGSALYPGSQLRYEVDPRASEVSIRPGRWDEDRMNLWVDDPEEGMTIRATNVRRERPDSAFGTARGDRVVEYFLDLPPTPTLESATLEYGSTLAATDAELANAVGGRVVIVADLRRELSGDYHPTPDGRVISGAYTHALAIDAILRGAGIRMASWRQQMVAMIVVAVAGMGLAARWPRSVFRRSAAYAVLTGAGLIGSVVVFSTSAILLNPSIPFIGMILAGEFAGLIHRVRLPLG